MKCKNLHCIISAPQNSTTEGKLKLFVVHRKEEKITSFCVLVHHLCGSLLTYTKANFCSCTLQCSAFFHKSIYYLSKYYLHMSTHCLDLDLNHQKTRRYFWQRFHISKNEWKLKYKREKKNQRAVFEGCKTAN